MKRTGDEYFDSEEFHELLTEYEHSVETGEPVLLDVDALSEIADYYHFTGRYDQAENAITLALSLSPGAIAPLTYRIHEALWNGKTEEAKVYLSRIVETNELDYVYDKAEIMIAEERVDDADAYFLEILERLPEEDRQDYIFDVEKFTSFEGNTGPYILYTIVRIKSILAKAAEEDRAAALPQAILPPENETEKALFLTLADFGTVIGEAAEELAPHRICGYIFQLSNDFNRFYHETRILQEESDGKRRSYLALLSVTQKVLEKSIGILGFGAPEHM